MYILQDKHLFSDDEIEFIMSPITQEPKLLQEEKGYKTVKRGPIGIAIKNFWTLFGFFSYFLIAAIIIGFIAWCFWVRKKAVEKRRKMEHTRTIESEESSGKSASEDEAFSVGSGVENIEVNIGGGGKSKRKKKKKEKRRKKKDKIKKTGNKKTKSQKESKSNKSKIKSKTKGRK